MLAFAFTGSKYSEYQRNAPVKREHDTASGRTMLMMHVSARLSLAFNLSLLAQVEPCALIMYHTHTHKFTSLLVN